MSASPGIVPDMRYISPAYLPMLVIGVYASTPASTAMGYAKPSEHSSGSRS